MNQTLLAKCVLKSFFYFSTVLVPDHLCFLKGYLLGGLRYIDKAGANGLKG